MSRILRAALAALLLTPGAAWADEGQFTTWFPPIYGWFASGNSGVQALNSANEVMAVMGDAYVEGGGSATCSAAGGCQIKYGINASSSLTSGTTIVFGVQDVDLTAGPSPRTDGTFDVSASCVYSGCAMAPGLYTLTMTSGSKTITDKQKIAFAAEMTVRSGTDSVTLQSVVRSANWPSSSNRVSGNWTQFTSSMQYVVIIADDGRRVWIRDVPYAILSSFQFASDDAPDEYCALMTTPDHVVYIDRIWGAFATASAGDLALNLYRGWTSPTLLESLSIDGNLIATLAREQYWTLASAHRVEPNTQIAACLAPATTNDALLWKATYAAAADKQTVPGWAGVSQGTRSDGSGDFTVDTGIVPAISVGWSESGSFPSCRDTWRGGGSCY